jgi:hypothetical protein
MTTTPTNQPPDPDELARLRAENARLREQPVPAHGFEDRWRPQLDGGKRREREKRDDDDAS